jgi:hypothetical protein
VSKIIGMFPVPLADRITLEFDSGQPIHGRLVYQSGAAHAFYGWLELSALVERAWRRAADPTIDAAGDLSEDDPSGAGRDASQVGSGGDD